MGATRRHAAKGNPFSPACHVGHAVVTVGAEGTNAINVAIQLRDSNNRDLQAAGAIHAYLADDEGGGVIAASAPDGGWAIGTDGLLIPIVANKAALLVSEADGDIDVTITESTGKTFYLILVFPDGGISSTAITFAA